MFLNQLSLRADAPEREKSHLKQIRIGFNLKRAYKTLKLKFENVLSRKVVKKFRDRIFIRENWLTVCFFFNINIYIYIVFRNINFYVELN